VCGRGVGSASNSFSLSGSRSAYTLYFLNYFHLTIQNTTVTFDLLFAPPVTKMSHPYSIGASQVLLRTSPFLAYAANIAKGLFNDQIILESLEHFERDLALIHLQISKLSQYQNTPEAATLDNHILRVYDFNALNQILDRTALARALERVTMAVTNIQPQVCFPRSPNIFLV
jgi:hypothetical protein